MSRGVSAVLAPMKTQEELKAREDTALEAEFTEEDIAAIRRSSIKEAVEKLGWSREKATRYANAFAESNRVASRIKIVRAGARRSR